MSTVRRIVPPDGRTPHSIVRHAWRLSGHGDTVTRRKDGIRYEVQGVQDWSSFNQPHFKARLVRIEGQ